ncbi:MAG: GNAT family N-acetyltransferase [Pseudomonadota bacterium]|nr:GNAT family N-acetyltransferase [Pseudomonadota bacterium]
MLNVVTYTSDSQHNDILYTKLYELTDYINTYYPKHREWFFNTFLPDLKAGTRAIVAVFNEIGEPVGVAFLKKSHDEHKICTLFVQQEYRKAGIGKILMQESIATLESAEISITVSGVNLPQLQSLLDRHGFMLVSQSHGDYLPDETEYYFIRPQR